MQDMHKLKSEVEFSRLKDHFKNSQGRACRKKFTQWAELGVGFSSPLYFS